MVGVGTMVAGVGVGLSLRRIAALIVSICACAAPAFSPDGAVAQEPIHRPQILILYSGDSLVPASEAVTLGFNGAVQAGVSGHPTAFTEFLDAALFPGPDHQARRLTFLQEKYAATHIDLMLVVGPAALGFVANNRA